MEESSAIGKSPSKGLAGDEFQEAFGANFAAKMCQEGAKMSLSWRTWRQDATKIANLEPQMTLLRGSRVTFWDRGRDLMKKWANSKNERQYSVLEGFWHAGGSGWRLSEPYFAHLHAILGYLGPSWRHSSTTERQEATTMEPK